VVCAGRLTLRPLKEMLGLRVERPVVNLDYLLKVSTFFFFLITLKPRVE